jgi:diguanylate cyclase (GGDEF)-like protein
VLDYLFGAAAFVPHGYCLLWRPDLVALHAASNLAIAIAYFSIPAALLVFLRRRKDLAFSWIFALFAAFILACGTGHLVDLATLWWPVYGLEGLVKAGTALVSLSTAAAVWPIIPRALALPSPAALAEANARLEAEAAVRSETERELRRALGELAAANERLAAEVEERRRAMDRLTEAERDVRRLAHHDPLTGLPNRLLFQDRLGQALAHARRERVGAAVMILDLDDFKGVNDTLGHAAGDRLLHLLAGRLGGAIRATDTLARLGGDEFAVVQPALREPEDAMTLARKLIGTLDAPFALTEHEAHVTASIGIALFPGDGADAGELLKNADLALYRAKREGRGQHRFFEPAMDAELRARRRLERELRRALERDELALVYQPQLDLPTGRITGVEALVRWTHLECGRVVLPDEFIPAAEASGLIQPLGAWVLREACRQAAAWRAEGLALTIAVNVSPAQLRHPDALEAVNEALRVSGLDPGLLELEITEGVLMETFGQGVPNLLGELAAQGVRLAIDDFGTGYSSLAYLKRLPVQRIKIDRSFVRDIGSDPEDEAVVQAIVSLGHTLGKEVVAEGVESEAQLAFLRRLGCDAVQGFLLARPQAPAELRHLLAA